ncbi:MAG: hypothetical protein II943_04180 [Victivallales bacterium]|nr:hypothetical protein [Victivallales bacterium]
MKRNIWLIVFSAVCCLGILEQVWATGASVLSIESAPILLEVRRPNAPLPLRGSIRISPKAVELDDNAVLLVDGLPADGWSVAEPYYDTTQLADGWHDFVLQEGDETYTERLWILNAPKYIFHEGIVDADETWGGEDTVHLIVGWTEIPEGVQVTMENGTKVLYAPDAGFVSTQPGNLGAAVVMDFADVWLDGRTTVLEATVVEHEEALSAQGERLVVVEDTLGMRTTLASAEIVGSDWLGSGSTRAYAFLVRLGDGLSFCTVPEWWLEGDDAENFAEVDAAGNLTAQYCESDREVELCGSYAYGGNLLSARKVVVIKPSDVVPTTFHLQAGWNLLACPFSRLTEASRTDLLARFQPFHYDAASQSYVQMDAADLDNASIWLHVDAPETIVLDLLVTQ